MAEISTVLYFKVMQWAGYSRDLKVADLERHAWSETEHRPSFNSSVAGAPGTTWSRDQEQSLAIGALSRRSRSNVSGAIP